MDWGLIWYFIGVMVSDCSCESYYFVVEGSKVGNYIDCVKCVFVVYFLLLKIFYLIELGNYFFRKLKVYVVGMFF